LSTPNVANALTDHPVEVNLNNATSVPNREIPHERSPRAIRDGFIAELEAAAPAAGTPAAELLANLRMDAFAHQVKVASFAEACMGLAESTVDFRGAQVSAFLANVIQVVSLNRDQARELEVFEFPATMPVDDLEVPAGTRLHPQTCELTTAFESAN
jgi:hypothetical protein